MKIADRDMMGGLSKGLRVIETFSASRPRQTIAEVAEGTGLDRATARRCLLTLAHQGYATWDGKFFTLTPRVLRLGTGALSAMPLPQIVQPMLDRLSEGLGESSSVAILDGPEIVYIARAAQTKIMSVGLMPGSRLPAFCSSLGRVLLAALPPEEARALLQRQPRIALTDKTLTDLAQIEAELARVREQGFALIDQEIEMGLRSVAVPLQDSYGRVVAALNTGVSVSRASAEALCAEFLPRLRALALELRPLLRRGN
jgi:IclR family pca regulon transcriptional regulator